MRPASSNSKTSMPPTTRSPWPVVIDKVHDRLIEQDLDILARSPLCSLATSDAQGNCDVSPRGDLAGFTHVLDAGTLALPDRPGNRRGDSFHNILDNPLDIDELYLHCPMSLRRSGVWDPASWRTG
ncbi:pyridoxamine 5'-phosphate oxidase family protein [Streptomyces massasporeus]|uniref:pyridoxamine 5'-phosphate oxidase family protein n=1 Tax=Streptomyces massasporeus TaxID=67324 RepID=UPI0036FBB709